MEQAKKAATIISSCKIIHDTGLDLRNSRQKITPSIILDGVIYMKLGENTYLAGEIQALQKMS
ncbi:hypothetical protein [Vibrio intestinalis]|uniref:hypothetical protein n=1 Tax=Vibrio intestinalis TaxID=2933291 RepID=UPI0021A86AC1|nr:hypothetical protein [Vibrio intestinalis]